LKNGKSQRTLNYHITPKLPKRMDFRIGIIGSGAIVRNCNLKAYTDAGFLPYGIGARNRERCQEIALQYEIHNVYDNWKDLIDDSNIEILILQFRRMYGHGREKMWKRICILNGG
jgi:hypothetical protein